MLLNNKKAEFGRIYIKINVALTPWVNSLRVNFHISFCVLRDLLPQVKALVARMKSDSVSYNKLFIILIFCYIWQRCYKILLHF